MNEFNKKLKKIFETLDYDTKFNEEDVEKKEFIHTSTDWIIYKIKVEAQEGEFYVFDKNGKQIDLFNLALVDQDGAVLKDVRKAIVDQYKKLNVSGMGGEEESSPTLENAGTLGGFTQKSVVHTNMTTDQKEKASQKKTAITNRLPIVSSDKQKE